ncbi:MAG: methyl-accepting chemotaxis protein [Wujia sp.]
MKLTIKRKIMLCSLGPILLLGIIVIVMTNTYIKNAIIDQVRNSLQGTAIATMAAYNQNSGEYFEASNGDIWKGSYNISQSESLVDIIREDSGMEVTFFYGTRRIMTSAVDASGERILGSPAGEKIADEVLVKDKSYFSENVSIDGTIYYGYYIPVHQDGIDEPVGMVFAGLNKKTTMQKIDRILNYIICIVLFVMIVCIVVATILANSISRAMKKSVDSVTEVASGKLNVEIDEKLMARQDEVGALTRAIAGLKDELSAILGSISDSANMLMEASDVLEQTSNETFENMNNVKQAVDAITDGATSQAEDVREASANVEHMGNLVTETDREAGDLNNSADVMRVSSDQATDSITTLKQISEEVMRAIDVIAEQTNLTNESAKQIREASNFISEIAEQTTLLSLNANIEAARAGESGKGFAVVATEIQGLAVESTNTADKINEIVAALMQNSENVVYTMAEIQSVIGRQNRHIEDTEATVGRVMDEIQSSVGSIKSIEVKAKELENARAGIVEIMNKLSDIAEDNVASTQETNAVITEVAESFRNVASSAENLRRTAQELAQHISKFEL